MKENNYRIIYGGAQEHQMRMVYSVYKESTFLFLKYWKICKHYTNRLTYAEFDTLQEALDYIKGL